MNGYSEYKCKCTLCIAINRNSSACFKETSLRIFGHLVTELKIK